VQVYYLHNLKQCSSLDSIDAERQIAFATPADKCRAALLTVTTSREQGKWEEGK
jgi:hypothetical protein